MGALKNFKKNKKGSGNVPINSEIKINIGIMREGKFQEIKEIPTLGDLNIEEPDELTRNSIKIIQGGLTISIENMQKEFRKLSDTFMKMGIAIKPYTVNNWRKRHGMPMRRKTR
jgi:hypothetical protein